mgnify:CR=1 FL=1
MEEEEHKYLGVNRPAVFIFKCGYEEAYLGLWKSVLSKYKSTILAISRSVGVIGIKQSSNFTAVGTGWVLDKDRRIIITNRHVTSNFDYHYEQRRPAIDFNGEYESKEEPKLHFIKQVLYENKDNDFVFLQLLASDCGTKIPPAITLDERVPPIQAAVVTIGFPHKEALIPSVYDKKVKNS